MVYLISAVLQSITIISSLSPITAIGPLMFVLFVGLIREGYEDYVNFLNYHRNDIPRTLRSMSGKLYAYKMEFSTKSSGKG